MQQELPWGPWSSTVNGELILDMPFQFQLWASLSLITFPRGDWFTTMLSFFGHDEAKTFCMPRWTRRTRDFYMPAGSFLVTIRFILEIALYILQKKKNLLFGHSIWVCGQSLCFLVLNLWWPCTYLSETLHSVGWSTATSCNGSPEHGGRWTRPPPPSSWRFSSSLQGHHLRPAAPHQVLRARWGFLVSISSIFFSWFRLQALTATMLELLLQATARGEEGMTLFFLCWHITEKMFICFLDAL